MINKESYEVENYLQRLRQKGELDSEGSFTVAGLRAVGKLAVFLLAEESDWILKVVQAACAAGSAELRINQTRASTQLHFQTPYAIDLSALEKSLTSATQKSEQPGLEDMACGLRAVGVGQLRDWVTKISVGSEVGLISCTEGLVVAERLHGETVQAAGSLISLGVAYPRGQSGKLGGLIRFGEAVQREHMALLLKARACPIPLILDGLRLDDLSETAMAAALETRAFLGVNAPPSETLDAIVIPGAVRQSEGKIQDRFCSHAPFLVSRFPGSGQARSLQKWFYNYTTSRETLTQKSFFFQHVPAPSRVHLVRHGVVVGSRNMGVTHPISVDIFLNANHMRGDLTGLNVQVTDSEVDVAKDQIRGAVSFLRDVGAQLQNHTSRPLKKELLLYGGMGALGLLMPALALKAVAGAVTTVMLARSAQNHRAIVKDCIEQLESFRAGVEASDR
jgi:hypothetical protein